MQLMVMNTVFLGGLREELRSKVLEQAPTEIRNSVRLARELEVIVHDRRAKGSHISSIQEERENPEEDQDPEEEEIINFLNAIRARRDERPSEDTEAVEVEEATNDPTTTTMVM